MVRLFIYLPARSGRAPGGWVARKEGAERNEQCEPIPYRVVRKSLPLSGRRNGYLHFTEPDSKRRRHNYACVCINQLSCSINNTT